MIVMDVHIDARADARLPTSTALSLLLLGLFPSRGVVSSGPTPSTFFSASPAMNVAVKQTKPNRGENKAHGPNSLLSLLDETSSGVLSQ
mmetsp:Transcript_39815/g.85850  ORF Transcript_39815/g.85850 Transcript_39815/m.85850 type:complete len:89 (+) Transcript_39815:1314-1580(+)